MRIAYTKSVQTPACCASGNRLAVSLIMNRSTSLETSEFYQAHLDRVSRSFAFCIQQLPEPMRARVGLAYLLFRLLDTVEDSPWPSREQQHAAFANFSKFISKRPIEQDVRAWGQSIPSNIKDGERRLLDDAFLLFSDFHAWPDADREALHWPALSMCRGMESYVRRSGDCRELRLNDLADANKYCFFVAGVVGEALTGLSSLHAPGFSLSQTTLNDAFRFGLFLQKVNLLKDQLEDEPLGRFLVPSRAEMRSSLAIDAAGAMRYILAIPIVHLGYRTFCAWSFFLGLASMPFIEEAFARKSRIKISREQTKELLMVVEDAAGDDAKLEALYQQAIELGAVDSEPSVQALGHQAAWLTEFRTLYGGALTDADIVNLIELRPPY